MNFRKLLHWCRQAVVLLFWPALALIIWGQLTSQPIGEDLTGSDKILHFTAYFGLSWMATIAVRADRRTLWCMLALIAMGATLEIVQTLVGRDGDIADEFANTMGVLLGAGLAWAGVGVLKARKLVEDSRAE